MNIRNILMMVLLSLMSGTTIKAQFNTVGCLYNHPANKTKNPQETNASPIVDNLMLKDSLKNVSSYKNVVNSCGEDVGTSSHTSDDILQYLNMAYPLKSVQINSEFGMRRHPVTHKYCMHNGVDLQARYEPVFSMLPGKVVKATIIGEQNSVCTETFLLIGPFDTEIEQKNCYKYICTNFFKTLLFFGRGTMQVSQDVFRFVPLQDFTSLSDIDWNKSILEIDNQFSAKYHLSNEEIAFVESMIKPM